MKSVLLIDDNPSIHKLLSSFSDLHGFVLHSAYDGKQGLDIILREKYDVILLDLMMPRYSGYDLLTDLKKKTVISDLNLFVFSAANMSKQQFDELKRLGVKDFLRKPIKLHDLLKLTGIESD